MIIVRVVDTNMLVKNMQIWIIIPLNSDLIPLILGLVWQKLPHVDVFLPYDELRKLKVYYYAKMYYASPNPTMDEQTVSFTKWKVYSITMKMLSIVVWTGSCYFKTLV